MIMCHRAGGTPIHEKRHITNKLPTQPQVRSVGGATHAYPVEQACMRYLDEHGCQRIVAVVRDLLPLTNGKSGAPVFPQLAHSSPFSGYGGPRHCGTLLRLRPRAQKLCLPTVRAVILSESEEHPRDRREYAGRPLAIASGVSCGGGLLQPRLAQLSEAGILIPLPEDRLAQGYACGRRELEERVLAVACPRTHLVGATPKSRNRHSSEQELRDLWTR